MDGKKLNIAVFVSSCKKAGGGFQYELRLCQLLKEIADRYEFVFFTLNRITVEDFEKSGMEVRLVVAKGLEEALISQYGIDLVYFLYPSSHAFINLHYILTVWDLCHRDFNEFPEVRDNHEFERRELFYGGAGLKKAVAIISDSKRGKNNIAKRYNIDKNRIYVLKFLPRKDEGHDFIDIRKKYDIDKAYIYYPAQFWAHKNHIYILKALKILKEFFEIEIFALFSGADYGNLAYILRQAEAMGVRKQVKYLGFVDDAEVPFLYKQSLALVMPTYFGPTNIPPLEAFKYETPICYSDLKGLEKQVKNAAFLLDLKDPFSLAKSLISIMNDKELVQEKVENGKKILAKWTPEDFKNKLEIIFNKFSTIRECWADTMVPRKEAGDIHAHWGVVMDAVIKLRDSSFLYALYGNGTVGKTIRALIPEKIVGYVDMAEEDHHPRNLLSLEYDRILISVLGREEEIVEYLVKNFGIKKEKIITLCI